MLRKWGAGAPRLVGPSLRHGPALLAKARLGHPRSPAGLPFPRPQGASVPTALGARPPGNKAWGEGQGVWTAGDFISPRLPPCPSRPPIRPQPAGFSAWLGLAALGCGGECPVRARLLLLHSPQSSGSCLAVSNPAPGRGLGLGCPQGLSSAAVAGSSRCHLRTRQWALGQPRPTWDPARAEGQGGRARPCGGCGGTRAFRGPWGPPSQASAGSKGCRLRPGGLCACACVCVCSRVCCE